MLGCWRNFMNVRHAGATKLRLLRSTANCSVVAMHDGGGVGDGLRRGGGWGLKWRRRERHKKRRRGSRVLDTAVFSVPLPRWTRWKIPLERQRRSKKTRAAPRHGAARRGGTGKTKNSGLGGINWGTGEDGVLCCAALDGAQTRLRRHKVICTS